MKEPQINPMRTVRKLKLQPNTDKRMLAQLIVARIERMYYLCMTQGNAYQPYLRYNRARTRLWQALDQLIKE